MKLTNPTDDELNAHFSLAVADVIVCDKGGWSSFIAGASVIKNNRCGHENCVPFVPRYTQYAEAVLPWLEKWRDKRNFVVIATHPLSDGHAEWVADLIDNSTNIRHVGMDRVLARAIVLALLPHYGVEVEFTA